MAYKSILDVRQTQIAVKQVKDFFETELAKALNLIRVTAPIIVRPQTGLNDCINGVERPVEFDILETGEKVQIVQSLAKWKRYALGRYGFKDGEGLYTDMNAIRRDEMVDAIHSIYVDQWDWEKIITKERRSVETLMATVESIYGVVRKTQKYIQAVYPQLEQYELPREITFVTTQELEDIYPELTPKERETVYVREHGAMCLMQIGGQLASGEVHDGRSPDYDDWKLNCDIILYYKPLDIAFEISSMGIRVDEISLAQQLKEAGCEERREQPFHKAILNGELPYTMGGGIGQSRLCMFTLQKAHIGEVQVSVWPEKYEEEQRQKGIILL